MITLFVNGEWSIVRHVTTNVYAYHNPCGDTLISASIRHNNMHTCDRCDVPIPKGVQALVALHNWGTA